MNHKKIGAAPNLKSSFVGLDEGIMLGGVLGTEILIEKMLSKLESKKDDDLYQWNKLDTEAPERKNISYVKMMHEIDMREAR